MSLSQSARKSCTAASLLASFALSVSTASADVPDANGLIHACYAIKNGAMSIIDTAVTANCKANELPIQWAAGPAVPPVTAGDIGFQVAYPVDIDGNGVADPHTDGLLLLRYLLGIRGAALVNNALGLGAARNAEQIEAFIQGTILPTLQ